MSERILSTTKVQSGWKISLRKNVREILNADIGDTIVFKLVGGKVIIEKG